MKFFPVVFLAPALFLMPAFAQDQAALLPKTHVAVDAFAWHFAPPVGSHWQIRSFVRTETKSVAPFPDGTPDASGHITELKSFIADYDVLSRDQFGATTSRITLRQSKFDIIGTLDGDNLKFSADRSEALEKALQDVSFTIKQSRKGEIWGIEGRDAITNRIANAIVPFQSKDANSVDLSQKQAQKQTDILFGADALRQMLGLGNAPTYPVVTSERWGYTVPTPTDFNYNFDLTGTHTLNRLTPELAFIASNASYDGSTAPVKPVLKIDGGDYSYDTSGIKASVHGAARVERSSGLTLESTTTWRINSVVISRPKNQPKPLFLRSTDDSTIEIHTLLTPR